MAWKAAIREWVWWPNADQRGNCRLNAFRSNSTLLVIANENPRKIAEVVRWLGPILEALPGIGSYRNGEAG